MRSVIQIPVTPDQSLYFLVWKYVGRTVAPSLKCLILEQGLGVDEAESSASALGVSHPAHADPAEPSLCLRKLLLPAQPECFYHQPADVPFVIALYLPKIADFAGFVFEGLNFCCRGEDGSASLTAQTVCSCSRT
ncbi:hypothetical protein [Bradyrhizobium sp. USDA 4454]